jgi:predicted phage gp36 major capsid-like protein
MRAPDGGYLTIREFEKGSEAALVAGAAASSAVQRIAELSWAQISGEFSSHFGQERSSGFLLLRLRKV